jgi:hypothetical protein
LEPIFGAYIWSLYLEPPALARVVPFFGICSKAPKLKAPKWCLYLVPSWLGALLSGAFLKIRCGVVAVECNTARRSRSPCRGLQSPHPEAAMDRGGRGVVFGQRRPAVASLVPPAV